MRRRTFIRNAALASSAMYVPQFLTQCCTPVPGADMSGGAGNILVVVQLSGGNDGLNTFVPYRNDIYYQMRPKVALAEKEILPVDDELGFNSGLGSLRPHFDDGDLCIVNNVGYPNPDRSHFRSRDIWQTASGSDRYLHTGWLGRYLDSECRGCDNAYHALEMDDTINLSLRGAKSSGFALGNVTELKMNTGNPVLSQVQHLTEHDHEPASYLYKQLIRTQEAVDYIYEKSSVRGRDARYPDTDLGDKFRQIAGLINAGSETQIYYLSQGGYDTHSRQKHRHGAVLKQYADALSAFIADLKSINRYQDVLVMTFSEFGRRVRQNASGGTGHGTAGNVILAGGRLAQPGFYNDAPDLTRLVEDDLVHTVDFREVYATILEKWLHTDTKMILPGDFEPLSFLA